MNQLRFSYVAAHNDRIDGLYPCLRRFKGLMRNEIWMIQTNRWLLSTIDTLPMRLSSWYAMMEYISTVNSPKTLIIQVVIRQLRL